MSKRIRNLIIAAVVLGALVGVYFLATSLAKKENDNQAANDTTATTVSYDVCTVNVNTLTNIKITKPGTDASSDAVVSEYTLSDDKTKWLWSENPALPLDSQYFASMATVLTDVKSTTKLTGVTADKLVDYGLASPAYVIEMTDGVNGTQVLNIGKLNTFNSQYYFSKGSEPSTVYTVAKTVPDAFALSTEDMILNDSLPVISEAKLVSVKLTYGTDERLYKYFTSGINPDVTTSAESGTDTVSDKWQLFRNGGEALDVAAETGDKLLKGATEMAFIEWKSYNSDDATLAEYGFDASLNMTVTYKVTNKVTDSSTGAETSVDTEKNVTFLLGKKDADGNYYAKLPDSVLIYQTNITDLGNISE